MPESVHGDPFHTCFGDQALKQPFTDMSSLQRLSKLVSPRVLLAPFLGEHEAEILVDDPVSNLNLGLVTPVLA